MCDEEKKKKEKRKKKKEKRKKKKEQAPDSAFPAHVVFDYFHVDRYQLADNLTRDQLTVLPFI